MNEKTDSQGSKFNSLKWLLIAALIIGGLAANYYFIAQPVALRMVGWLVLMCAVLLIARYTDQGQRFWAFAQDARVEMRKVVWPTRPETIQTTLVVVAMVIVMAIFLWGLDTLLFWLTSLVTVSK